MTTMSDKRSLDVSIQGESSENNDTDNKRQKLDKLTDSGPLTQRDVVYYQKEAIFRQLTQYKAQCGILEQELLSYTTHYQNYRKKLLVLNEWVDQFIEFAAALVSGDNQEDSDVLIIADIDDDDDKFVNDLNEKKIKLNKLIAKLSSNISFDASLNIANLNKEIHEIRLEKTELVKQNELLSENYKSLNKKYLNLLNQSERLNSKTVQRFGSTKKEETNSIVKKETPEASDGVINDKIKDLELELNQQKSLNESQEQLIKEQLNKLTVQQDELINLNKRQSLSQSDIKSSIEYQTISKDFEALNLQHNEHLQKYDVLFEKFQALEKESNQLNDLFSEKFESEKKKIVSQFETLEKDLIRIRTARDELLSKNSILEAQKSHSELVDELRKTIESQQETVNSLKFENITSQLVEDSDIESLKRKNSILTQELQSLEAAFKSTHSTNYKKITKFLEVEQNFNKFKVEKQKADQKYFSAMRSNDSLSLQIKNLKELNSNYETKISNLQELKEVTKIEVENLTSTLANTNKLVNLKQRENDQLSKNINALELKLKDSTAKFEILNKKYDGAAQDLNNLNKSETTLKLENKKLANQNETLTKQLNRYKSQTSDEINNEQLDQFRSLIYCSLCSKNWKNTVIKQCGHFFCDECTKERLAARMRKCPTCNKQFSSNDLLTVHL